MIEGESFYYRCIDCGREYRIEPDLMLCPECSRRQGSDKPLRGVLEVVIARPTGGDVYSLLPVEREYFPSIPVGNTPMWRPLRVRAKYGFEKLYLKDDTLNPTGSFKDRASYLVAAFAKKYGFKSITVASTGNAASSMAGVGAAAGIRVKIFIPSSAPRAKMVQSYQYGAEVTLVEGTYDEAFDESIRYTRVHGGLNRNTAYNPMTIEGKKTVSIEIFNQLGYAPDYIFVPVGDGVILSGVYKGFKDLMKSGFIGRMPVIYGVQAEGSSAICRALKAGDFGKPVVARTVADSISVEIPRGGYYALKALKEFNGRCITVSDDEILGAQRELASLSGLFAEPASAAAYAGFLKVTGNLGVVEREEGLFLRGKSGGGGIKASDTVVVLLTGSGLKDIDAAARGVGIKI